MNGIETCTSLNYIGFLAACIVLTYTVITSKFAVEWFNYTSVICHGIDYT